MIERVEGVAFFEGEGDSGVADHVLGREDNEGGGVVFQDTLEAEPGAGRSFAKLDRRGEKEIEHDERESAIVQEHVRGLDCFFCIGAADPKEASEKIVFERGGIERISGIDQGEPFPRFAGAFEEGSNEKGCARGGAVAEDFGDGAFWESTVECGIEERKACRPAFGDALTGFGGHFDAGKFGGQELAQLDDVPGVL